MSESDAPTVVFAERQQFRQPLLWAVVIISAAFFVGITVRILVEQFYYDNPWTIGGQPISSVALALFGGLIIVLNVGAVALFAATNLQIEVTGRGLFVRYWPFQRRVHQIDLAEVRVCEPVEYQPFRQFGGRGIRWARDAKVYSVSGNDAVRLEYSDGFSLFLGTQHAEALAQAIMPLLAPPPETH